MSELTQVESLSTPDKAPRADQATAGPARPSTHIYWLQGITLLWMLAECGVSLYAAAVAHSPALAAFGSDSLVELLSATVVLAQFMPQIRLPERTAARAAAVLLFALAGIVGVLAIASLVLRIRPETSRLGMGITLAALVVMPALATLKRREAGRTHNAALAADAVQSATCAYLAGIVLVGLAINAFFHIAWFDAAAALLAIPLLLKEGREAWRGHVCACC